MTCVLRCVHNQLAKLLIIFNSTGHILIINTEIFTVGKSIYTQNNRFNATVYIFVIMIFCPTLATSETCFLAVCNHSANLCIFKINTCHIKHTKCTDSCISTCKVIVSTRRNSVEINKHKQCNHTKSSYKMENVAVINHKIAESAHINKVGNNSNNAQNK